MSDCNVCLGTDDFDFTWDFSTEKIVKARKEHKCCECERVIAKGQTYEYFSAHGDDQMFTFKTCLLCAELRESFTCEPGYAIPHESLWSDIKEFLFPEMTTGCLQKVKTVEAKQFLIEKWQEWKGLRAR